MVVIGARLAICVATVLIEPARMGADLVLDGNEQSPECNYCGQAQNGLTTYHVGYSLISERCIEQKLTLNDGPATSIRAVKLENRTASHFRRSILCSQTVAKRTDDSPSQRTSVEGQ